MWNLIKNVFRSLGRNKASVIGLTFLVFLSVGIFTILNSVSSNISSEYQRISVSGNLHDFTVSENYVVGNPKYDFTNNATDSTYMGTSSDNEAVAWPEQPIAVAGQRTYQISLNVNDQTDSLLIAFYTAHNQPSDKYYNELLHPLITITNTGYPTLSYLNDSADHHSTKTKSEIETELNDSGDYSLLATEESKIQAELINIVTQTDTPMEQYLSNDLSNSVQYRNFKSLDINNSPDGKLYKIVQSNEEDTIDKVVLFGENQQSNFSTRAFNPLYGAQVDGKGIDLNKLFPDTDDPIGACLAYNNSLPASFDDFKNDQKAQAFFQLLARGDDVSLLPATDNNLYGCIQNLSGSDSSAWSSSQYNTYISTYRAKFFLQNKGYKYAVNWNLTTPQSWSLLDWTARYAVVSPEYLAHNNIQPFEIKDRNAFINDLNSGYAKNINSQNTNAQFNDFINAHKSNTILDSVDSVNLPTVVIGGGITADFIYPILNIQHSTPNPNNECIIFGNSSTYKRIFDSYRGNPTENYLVGTFNKGVNQKQTLDTMNAQARQLMSWPQGIQACYMANDTNDTLNASAFRIAFIPSLVSKLGLIDIVLTAFVIILSLFICAVVIQRYISNSRTQIGVMQANGITKRKIAFSLAPFALLPAFVGGIGGYLVGFFLQKPTIGLLSNYWMLPTPLASFNIWILLISVLLPFVIFLSVSIVATFVTLREKTVNLMKVGSEFKGGFVARHIKEPFRSFGIMTKFRISMAFNSIWKLVLLSLMVTMSISTLVFGINTMNKFNDAEQQTFASRNYSYAVDLYSPTNQGGQYVPIDADIAGQTGFVDSTEGTNWLPSIYFTDKSESAGDNSDYSYQKIFGGNWTDNYYHQIPKTYYAGTYSMYNTLGPSGKQAGDVERSFIYDGIPHSSILYPMASDAYGEIDDLMYLKNRSMFKTGLDFNIGALGMISNPWSIAVSLMPENNKNMADGRTIKIIQALGEAVCWNDSTNNPYFQYYSDFSTYSTFFSATTPDDPNDRIDPNCPNNYSLNKNNCICSSIIGLKIGNLVPKFMTFLNRVYTDENFQIVNTKYDTTSDNDYQILYSKVPLKSTTVDNEIPDETYTYLAGNQISNKDSIKIVGLKSDSQYVNLKNAGDKTINDLINNENTLKDIKEGFFPIVINAFAQHKYHLSVNDQIQFNITNKANRFTESINQSASNLPITFKVVGVNTTYQGEEYYTNQELANYILGLRSQLTNIPGFKLPDTCRLHNYYINSSKQGDVSSTPGHDSQWYAQNYNIDQVGAYKDATISQNDLMDLNLSDDDASISPNWINPAYNYLNNGETNGNLVPYGFNGVFTQRTNGSAILNGGIPLYSPSGIYPGNDSLNSDVVKGVLQQSANLEFANVITGYSNTDGGKNITNLFKAWQNATNTDDRKNKFAEMNEQVDNFTNWLVQTYGNTAVTMLVQGASDKSSTHLIFNNLSNTISQVEQLILAVVALMVIIIVMLITVMLIGDSKRLAAVLKALGYSDKENISSFLSVYTPVIALGLLLSIPVSIAMIYVFQSLIFAGAGILLTATIKWWTFAIGMAVIVVVFGLSGIWGYYSLKRERLIDMMKG